MRQIIFVVRESLRLVALLLTVSFVTFALLHLSPIDPVQQHVGTTAFLTMSEEKQTQLYAYWSADTPLIQTYAQWLWQILHGDFGTSLIFNQPVLEVIAERASASLMLMAFAWIASGVLGTFLGVVAAAFQGRFIDKIIKTYCYLIVSMPTFWFAMCALFIFGVWLHLVPIGLSGPIGVAAQDITWVQRLHHLVLPAITLAVLSIGNVALHTREKAIDIMGTPFMEAAMMRGLTPGRALRVHGLRNILLPAITLQAASISEIFGGSVLVEQVFSYPGLGQAAVSAGLSSDAALLAGITLIASLIVFLGNLGANLIYPLVDPRMKDMNVLRGAL